MSALPLIVSLMLLGGDIAASSIDTSRCFENEGQVNDLRLNEHQFYLQISERRRFQPVLLHVAHGLHQGRDVFGAAEQFYELDCGCARRGGGDCAEGWTGAMGSKRTEDA
jgi:hypothetical protein